MGILNRNELRRLEKAAREKDKRHLMDWATQYEQQIISQLRREFELRYQEDLQSSIDNLMTAVAYTSVYSEESLINKDNLADFMSDLFVTIDMFRTGEYSPKEYKEQLEQEGIELDNYDNDKIYKNYLKIFDTDLVEFLKNKSRKIVTICGNAKYKDIIEQKQRDLTVQGYIVFVEAAATDDKEELLEEERVITNTVTKDTILISDILYVINKDGYLSPSVKTKIKFAQEHNKEIQYLENIT